MYYSPQFVHRELHVLSFFSLGRVFFDNLEKLFERTDEKWTASELDGNMTVNLVQI